MKQFFRMHSPVPFQSTIGETLAISGGKPVRNSVFPPWPYYSTEEIEAVQRVLKSGKVNYWTGSEGKQFEQEFADYVDCKHGIALANGTVALELALFAAGVGEHDEVIVPTRTFIATASCVVMRGAIPVVADVDPVSGNITVETINRVRTNRTKAVIVVHLAGWPCEMDSIMDYAKAHGLIVIEDCAQAHGARYKGRHVGSFGHAGAFSFCQDKIMSTGGEGGMLVTNDKHLWQRAWSYKDHGMAMAALNQQYKSKEHYVWLHDTFGTNFRMTEMQAAIGRIQLHSLRAWVERRRHLASMLTQYLSRFPCLRVESPPSHMRCSYYKYYVFIRPKHLGEKWNRNKIIEAINAEGIPCRQGSCCEIYREKAFEKIEADQSMGLPVARDLAETSIMCSVHPTLSDQDIHDTCLAVNKVLSMAMLRANE